MLSADLCHGKGLVWGEAELVRPLTEDGGKTWEVLARSLQVLQESLAIFLIPGGIGRPHYPKLGFATCVGTSPAMVEEDPRHQSRFVAGGVMGKQ